MTRSARPRHSLPPRPQSARLAVGIGSAALGLVLLTVVLVPLRDRLSLASIVLLYLVLVVAVSLTGGLWLALATAVASDLVVNFFFVPPLHTFAVRQPDHLITLVVYVAAGVAVSVAVDLAARQRAEAARSGVEAALLARITAEPIGERSLDALLEQVRDTLHMSSAAVVESRPDGDILIGAAGPPPGPTPALSVPAEGNLRLVLDGPAIMAADPRLLRSLAAAVARAAQAQRLAVEAARARELAEIDRLRAALLAAVGHDLRTPLAGIKAGVSSLRDPDLDLTEDQRQELLATVEESTDRMDALVENLLAQSRLQAGALSVTLRPVALDEVVALALLHLPSGVEVDVPDDLPLAQADPGLLERVVANLVTNAVRASPPSSPVRVRGRAVGGSLELAVIDHGPGIPAHERDRMFEAFQSLSGTAGGTGLGLTIAKGFAEAMGGSVVATETPGGGATMTVLLPAATSGAGPP